MITTRLRHGGVFAVEYSYEIDTSAPTASARAWDVPRCTTSSTFMMAAPTTWTTSSFSAMTATENAMPAQAAAKPPVRLGVTCCTRIWLNWYN